MSNKYEATFHPSDGPTDARELVDELSAAMMDIADYDTGFDAYARAVLPVVAAEVEAAVSVARAEAWDKGYTAGHSNAMRKMSDEPNAPKSPNPYRGETR